MSSRDVPSKPSESNGAMEQLRQRIANLSPEKIALLEKRLRQAAAGGNESSIPQRPSKDRYALSFAQERLWFLDQLHPNDTTYLMNVPLWIDGPLDRDAVRKTIQAIVDRHESLRTTIQNDNGTPFQVIHPRHSVDLAECDLPARQGPERDVHVQRWMQEQCSRSFDLSRGPVLRASLLRIDGRTHLLLLAMHHICSDGWSLGVLSREFQEFYTAFSEQRPPNLPDLPIQYADYAEWQRGWLQGPVLQKQVSYWLERLDGRSMLQLPSDGPRPADESAAGGQEVLVLPADLSSAIKGLSRQAEATLFMTLLTAFKTLLQRYSGEEDIVIGFPVAGRNRREVENLVGFFVNTLVLRADLSGNPTFRGLLRRVRSVALEAYSHQDLPFEKLVEELQPERDLSRNPLFDVLVNVMDRVPAHAEFAGLKVKRLDVDHPPAKFPITLYAGHVNSALELKLVYQQELLSPERMRCLLPQLRYLLEQIVNDPDQPIGDYSLIPPETRSLLPDPKAALPEPAHEPVMESFIRWAAEQPERPAVRQDGRAWTYRELAAAADSVARVVRARGIAPGEVVALTGQRSFGLIAGLMGILRSGAVVMTIDSSLPESRKQTMLREGRAKALIFVAERPAGESWWEAAGTVVVGGLHPEHGTWIDEPVPGDAVDSSVPQPSAEDAAYVFFTSGTSGVPKAVLGLHKSLSHFLHWQRAQFQIGTEDRVAQLTGLSFDVILRDIFLPLTSGGTLCLPAEREMSGAQTLLWLESEEVNVLHVVPAVAQSWLADLPEGVTLSKLHCIFLAGEPLTQGLVERWRECFPESGRLINLYGPTETTLVKCFHEVAAQPRPGVQPVGRPLPDTQALVLSRYRRLCGVSELGEIVFRTPFRTAGYLNAPEEQRKRFAANPFREDDSDLLYFTGDRGRYLPDGSLEILGRLDDQVKIRGVRIEPGEVAATLLRHADVQQSFVMARLNQRQEAYLAAYIVREKASQLASQSLRAYAESHLPPAMVPAVFVFLEALPLTVNGKVDRKALPVPEPPAAPQGDEFAAPRDSIEQEIACIWAEVLKVGPVSVLDNFFDLGGHSLLGTQVMSRISRAIGQDLPLRLLFEAPTVAGLSEAIVRNSVAAAESEKSSAQGVNLGLREAEGRGVA